MDFEPSLQPPLHIPVAFGSVRAKKKLPLQSAGEEEETSRCFLCRGLVKVEPFTYSILYKQLVLTCDHYLGLLSG